MMRARDFRRMARYSLRGKWTLAEGDRGKLSFQGTRFLGFDRIR